MAILISDKVNFKEKTKAKNQNTTPSRDREVYYIMIHKWLHLENKAILNVNAPNNKATIYEAKAQRSEQIGKLLHIAGDVNNSSLNNWQNNQKEDQQGYRKTEQHHHPAEFNWY